MWQAAAIVWMALGVASPGSKVAEPPEVPEGPEVPKAADAKERGIALPPELDQVLRDYERAWQARDPRALADLFAADGCVLADGKPLVRGRSAIRAAYARSGGPRWLRAEKFAAERRTAYIIGVYGHEPDAPETGKFVLALERGPTGRWLIAADIDNGIGPRRAP